MSSSTRIESRSSASAGVAPLVLELDDYGLESFLPVAASFPAGRYGYVVTPNADHIIRLQEEPSFRALYAAASYVLLDSRFVARVLRWAKGLVLPVCTGADLTAALFETTAQPHDGILVVGGTPEQAAVLSHRYGLRQLRHYDPPMGFIEDPAAVEACLDFVETHSPFRFCFLAVGSPRQEVLAQALQQRDRARGLVLCIGASINFITGAEVRAPRWIQQLSLEWLFRLLQDPRRLFHRYAVRGPRVFRYLRQARVVVRPPREPPPGTQAQRPPDT